MNFRVLFLFLLLPSSFFCMAQQESQPGTLFKIEDDELIWQCIYPAEANMDSLITQIERLLKGKVYTRNVLRNELGFDGEIHNYKVDCKKYGRNFFNTPKMYWEGNWFGKFFVEVKDNKYRVTIYGLFYERTTASTTNSRQKESKKYSYASHVTKDDGSIKRSERDNMLLMSQSLKDEFDLGSIWFPMGNKW